jgi:signal transduction histidine kinase
MAVIIATALSIGACSLTVGAWFMNRSVTASIETMLLVAIDIANQYITKEIEVLKLKADNIAHDIKRTVNDGVYEGVFERIEEDLHIYLGFGIFSETDLLYSWGKTTVSPDLLETYFIQTALVGGGIVSTTMHSPDGLLVQYVAVPISEGLALAAVLPGHHISELVSRQFGFWETGNLWLADHNGDMIANIRPQWVDSRINLIEMGRENPDVYGDIGSSMQYVMAEERGIVHFSTYGIPRIGAFSSLSSPAEDWVVGVIAPNEEGPLNDIPNIVFIMGSIMMILSIVAAIISATFLRRLYKEVDYLRKKAEMLSAAKTTFLANVSHEIRTPMNNIIGFSELAANDDISPRTKRYLNSILSSASWLLLIIDDILDLSKLEYGKLELEHIPFDWGELFANCRALVMPKAVEKGIPVHFYVELPDDRLPLGDPTKLRQVFTNLLSNAIKFTDTGVIKMSAILKYAGKDTLSLAFEIKDSGIGMTPEQIERIFDPFVQAEASTARKHGGTGLGLTITNNIVTLLGGQLSVESTPGVGSTFSFELTFETIEKSGVNAKHTIERDVDKPSFKGEVLLCEDNAANQEVICEHLKRIGINVVVAENGKAGVEMIKDRMQSGEKQFDLVFMDIYMPVMDGLEAADRINGLNTGVPIVALTANVMIDDRELYKRHGMVECLGKPFTSQELWKCLLRYFVPVHKD